MHRLSMTYMHTMVYCNFGALHDELFRDMLVAGTHDKRLLERLQLDDGDLTLEKAVTCIRQSEKWFTSNKFFFVVTTQNNFQLMR